jgi:hypothetical protein
MARIDIIINRERLRLTGSLIGIDSSAMRYVADKVYELYWQTKEHDKRMAMESNFKRVGQDRIIPFMSTKILSLVNHHFGQDEMATMEAPLTTFVDDLSSTLPQPTTSTAPNATSMRSEASLAPSSTTAATMTTERGRSGPTAPLVPSAVHAKEGGGIFKKVIRAMSRDRTHAMDHPTIDPRGISRERLAEIVVEEG